MRIRRVRRTDASMAGEPYFRGSEFETIGDDRPASL